MAVEDLAARLGCAPSVVMRLFDDLTGESVLGEKLVGSVEFPPDPSVDLDDDDDVGQVFVRVVRFRVSGPDGPLVGRGLGELGFFPYSLPETEDRLALIEEALASADVDDADRDHLWTAAGKLAHWRQILTRDPMS